MNPVMLAEPKGKRYLKAFCYFLLRHQQLAGRVGDGGGRVQRDAGVPLREDVREDRSDPAQQAAASHC